MKQRGFRYCSQCHTQLQKNGYNKTKTGNKTKWRCPTCLTNRQQSRSDLSRKYLLKGFVRYITGTQTAAEQAGSVSTFRRHMSWCWQIDPRPPITGEVYDYIVVDAKPVAKQMCAIVRHRFIINWLHGVRENSYLWLAVLSSIPRPRAVVCDGQKGISKALKQLWPTVVIQRCLFHVARNIRTKLTAHPQTAAGRDLAWLMTRLWEVHHLVEMSIFIAVFSYMYEQHQAFLSERTQNTNPQSKRKWWYTHGDVRSAYRQLDKLIEDDQLFASITHPELNLPRTTNQLEGGVNSRLDELLHRHRGMKPVHQRRVVDWYLDSRTETPYSQRKDPKIT